MNTEIEGFPRIFVKIQDDGRISLPKKWRNALNWQDGDQLCLYLDSGRITVENLEAKWRKKK